jgi:hypothetical protein
LTGAIFFVLTPAIERAAAAAPDEVQPATLVIAPAIAVGLLLVNVTLAVFKPAARILRPSTRATARKGIPS